MVYGCYCEVGKKDLLTKMNYILGRLWGLNEFFYNLFLSILWIINLLWNLG